MQNDSMGAFEDGSEDDFVDDFVDCPACGHRFDAKKDIYGDNYGVWIVCVHKLTRSSQKGCPICSTILDGINACLEPRELSLLKLQPHRPGNLYELWWWRGGLLTFQNTHKLEDNDESAKEYDYFGNNAQSYQFYVTPGECRDIATIGS